MQDLSIIIPVHEFNNEVKELLDSAIQSCENNQIYISTTNAIANDLKNIYSKNKNIFYSIENNNTDFCSLINKAVQDVKTKYFSILEYDDVYTSIFFKYAEKYIHSDVGAEVYLTFVDLYDFNKMKDDIKKSYRGYANEAPWALSFSNELGYIDKECLETYFNFNLTGGIFNTETFIKIGMLKPNIKMSFWYEFMLRLTNKDYKIYVIPKVGYIHFLKRENSLSEYYSQNISQEEGDYWFNIAKTEYFYTEHRNIMPFKNNNANSSAME